MITQFKRTLSKELSHLRNILPQKKNYSPEDFATLLSELQLNLESSFVNLAEATDKKLTDSKNSLKKSNKALNDFRLLSDKKQLEITKENDELRRELERSKKKVT